MITENIKGNFFFSPLEIELFLSLKKITSLSPLIQTNKT